MPNDSEGLEQRLSQIEQRLTEIEDREAIRRLIADYRQHLDARDLRAYSLLFAEDGTWSGGIGDATGPEAIRTMLEAALGPNPPAPGPTLWHVGMDPVIDLTGDHAKAVTIWGHARRGPGDTPEYPTLGHYDDTLTKESGEWRFKSRDAKRDIPAG